MQNLIVYYSLTENTKLIAEMLSKTIDADIVRIEPKIKYSKIPFFKTPINIYRITKEAEPELEEKEIDFLKYDNIYLGTPVWGGTFAPPIKSFIKFNDFKEKDIYYFMTYSSDAGKTFTDLNKLLIKDNYVRDKIGFKKPKTLNQEKILSKLKSWIQK